MALLVGPVLGEPLPHFPLYVVEAVIVELVAFAVPVRRPLAFSLVCGVLIGTLGLASEALWTQAWMVLPWTSALWPSGYLLALVMAVAGACVGGWLGARLAADGTPSLRPAAVLGACAMFALIGYGLISTGSAGVRGTVELSDAGATVRLDPRDGADDAYWFTATSWQGGGLVVDRLQRVAPGVYRSGPLPTEGDWKTMLRLHSGNALTALPIYLPADPAIPVKGIPARAEMQRPFGPEQKLLQRERKTAATWLWALAYGVVLIIALGFLFALVWGVHRVSANRRTTAHGRFERAREPAAVGS
jgi:hypothetical protein